MEVTFLREKDIWDDNALEVIQAYGTAVGISDVAIALGTGCGGTKDIAGVTSGCVWLASSSFKHVCTVYKGSKYSHIPNKREIAGRPAMLASVTSKIRPDNVRTLTLPNGKTVQICEYGAYPQTVAPKDVSQELEVQYQKNALKTTGKT